MEFLTEICVYGVVETLEVLGRHSVTELHPNP